MITPYYVVILFHSFHFDLVLLVKVCACKDIYWWILGSEHMFICSGQLHIRVKNTFIRQIRVLAIVLIYN